MPPPPNRPRPASPYAGLISLAATLGLVLVLVTTLAAAPAGAATAPTGPRITLAEAVLTLPAAAALPAGNVTSDSETTVPRPTGLNPCNLAATSHRLNLHDNGAAIGIYATPASASVADLAQWVVATRVFADTVAAHSAVARLGVIEKSCPRLAKVKESGSTTTFTRTWSGRYVTGGGWHGYLTVDLITIAGRASQLRHIAVYLQKGNALIQVDEIATVVGHNSAVQESRRLAVQQALALRVDAAEAT